MKCKICNAENGEFLFSADSPDDIIKKQYSVQKCNKCSSITTILPPNYKKDESLYCPRYYGVYPKLFRGILKVLNNMFLDSRIKRIAKIISSGIVLDYGCGNGEFLFRGRDFNWEMYGMDPNFPAQSPYITKSLEEFGNCKKYDLVTLWHVFEHMEDPLNEIRRIKKVLKNDGVLFLCLPNFDSWEARIAQKRWFHLDVPRHLYHYTPASITNLLKFCDFKIVEISYSINYYNIFGIFQTIFNLCGCPMNFLYYSLKKGIDYRKRLSFSYWLYSFLFHIVFFFPILALAFCLSLTAIFFKKTGTMEVVALKNENSVNNSSF